MFYISRKFDDAFRIVSTNVMLFKEHTEQSADFEMLFGGSWGFILL